LLGPYLLSRKLGEGGFGAVYEAQDPETKQRVAIKTLHRHLSQNEQFVERFRREGLAAGLLQHPGAVRVLGSGETDDGTLWISMEYLDGETLHDLLDREYTLSPARLLSIFTPVCGVLAEAHEKGIIHRDVKPPNIYLLNDPAGPVAKVLDFGISKLLEAGTLTNTGAMMGTPAYMPPEQWEGAAHTTAASDVYALGIIAYQCLSGRYPFEADTPAAWLKRHCFAPPASLAQVTQGHISGALEAAILTSLEKEPADRYQSPRAFLAALEAAIESLPEEKRQTPLQDGILSLDAPAPPSLTPGTTRAEAPEAPLLLSAAASAENPLAAQVAGAAPPPGGEPPGVLTPFAAVPAVVPVRSPSGPRPAAPALAASSPAPASPPSTEGFGAESPAPSAKEAEAAQSAPAPAPKPDETPKNPASSRSKQAGASPKQAGPALKEPAASHQEPAAPTPEAAASAPKSPAPPATLAPASLDGTPPSAPAWRGWLLGGAAAVIVAGATLALGLSGDETNPAHVPPPSAAAQTPSPTETAQTPASSPSTPKSNPGPARFQKLDSGPTLDTQTKLMWASRDAKERPWKEAKEFAENYQEGGFDDWRLPTTAELQSLYQPQEPGHYPACDPGRRDTKFHIHHPPSVRISCYGYWTSDREGNEASYVNFRSGSPKLYNVAGELYALPVRSTAP
jgi:serine/threonine-protein kinase